MEPYTFTFDDIGSKAPSGAGLMGKPRRFPTKYGCGVGEGCWASSTPVAIPAAMVTAPVSQLFRVIRPPPRPGGQADDSARGAECATYSDRSATMGSTRAARWAGNQDARPAAAHRTAAAPAYDSGSAACTPWSWLARSRVTAKAPSSPR